LNRRIQSIDYRGAVVSSAYDGFNNLVSVKDASNNTTEYRYDALNRLINTADSLGQISRIEYDKVGNKTHEYLTVDTGIERHTEYKYDELNRQYAITTAVGTTDAATTRTSYDKVGNILGTIDALGRIVKIAYDNLNRQTAITQAFSTSDATTTSYTYDKVGNRLLETNGRGYTTEYAYDEIDRQKLITDAYGNETRTEYFDTDSAVSTVLSELGLGFGGAVLVALTSKVIKTTDALANSTYTLYDRYDRQIATFDATKHQTSALAYDAIDRILESTDTYGQITQYSYLDSQRKQVTIDAFAGITTAQSDTAGNLTDSTDQINRTTH
jgi:YD repeat-containing protein